MFMVLLRESEERKFQRTLNGKGSRLAHTYYGLLTFFLKAIHLAQLEPSIKHKVLMNDQ